MPSENEMIDQPDDDQPDTNREIEVPPPDLEQETAVVVDAHVGPESDPATDGVVETEQDWDAWLGADPGVEEIASVPEPAAEPDTEPVDKEEPAKDEVEEKPVEDEVAEKSAAAEIDEEPAAAESKEKEDEAADESVAVSAEIGEADAVAEVSAQPDEPLAAAPVPPPVKPQKQQKTHRHGLTVKDVIRYFAPCGRCGFFLSGYRAAYGRDNLETAVVEAKDGWLTLSWGNDTREMLLKSYGSRVETSDIHFDGCCLECRRVFTYHGLRSDDKPATLSIEIKPGMRQTTSF